MSLPIAIGAKSVSSRPLIGRHDNHPSPPHFAEDGITELVPVQIPGSVPLTAVAVCPLQEWMAFVTIEYFDMLMRVEEDDEEDNQNDEEDNHETQTTSTGSRRRLVRHSTVADLRIQISPLGLPFSSQYPTTVHRLTLPKASDLQSRFFEEDHIDQIIEQTPVQPSLVFSSNRRQLACLIPYLRGPQSALVAFNLQRPPRTQYSQSRPRPTVPSYITTPQQPRPTRLIPQAQQEPQWLTLPIGGTALDIQHNAQYWLHNITSICNASMQSNGKGSSVLLAGCRDGSILGISFQPLLLVGRLYHPSEASAQRSITFLSHLTTTSSPQYPPSNAMNNPDDDDNAIIGRLVAIQDTGNAQIFQTRMILSSLVAGEDLEHSHQFNFDDSTTNYPSFDVDVTETSVTDHDTNGKIIHAESFSVVTTGRRHSLPANSRLAEESQPLLYPSPYKSPRNGDSPLGNTGLLMFLEFLSEYPGSFCRGEWISGGLLALLQSPISPLKRSGEQVATGDNNSRHRVALVLGVLPNRSPEVLTELTLSSEDLQEHAHTKFSLDDEDVETDDDQDFPFGISSTNNYFRAGNIRSALEATLGIEHDFRTGCLAISSARRVNALTPKNGNVGTARNNHQVRVFVCIWNWRKNVSGFTAVATSSASLRPVSRLFIAKEASTSIRRLAHISSPGSNGNRDRIRKYFYEIGTLSPSQDVRSCPGVDLHLSSPMLLTSTSIMFASVSKPSDRTTEVEWQECSIPISYRLQYGSPSIATMSSSGKSIAVAASRGLCVLECTPRAKKFSVGKDREYIAETTREAIYDPEAAVSNRGYMLPPKWHFFGNETEEKAFRVLTMAWWRGNTDSKRSHSSDDLLVAVVQIQRQEERQTDRPGTCYLACWSQRRLDVAHQRLRPTDDELQSSRCQWGARLPEDFRPKSLKLLEQPLPSSARGSKQRERKAMVLVTSVGALKGAVEFLMYQLQVIASVGRTQSSESYQEHRPFSVLSKQCAGGKIECSVDGSAIASVFLASASFQFDLRQRRSGSSVPNLTKSSQANDVNEIVGALGIVRSPGGGLEAAALTSAGVSRTVTMFSNSKDTGAILNAKSEMKSSELTSFWLSDIIVGQHPFSTDFGGRAVMDFYVWALQVADGKIYSWFVPCLEFLHDPSAGASPENAFSSRIMLGLICPLGSSTTWLQPSPTKTGKDFMIGSMPQSAHGCVLSSAQASKKFYRTIVGDFDNSLFSSDFLEHEMLYPRDFELSPPAFISSIAALLRCKAFFTSRRDAHVEKLLRDQNAGRCPGNAGGYDLEKALLTINAGVHMDLHSKLYQDAAFMACRLILLRTTEQLTDDIRKQRADGIVDTPLLSKVVLVEMLGVVKKCSLGRLQFASLVLEVGRQLEPSCFPNLFPLPVMDWQGKTIGDMSTTCEADHLKLHDLRNESDVFSACLEDGSLLCAVSTLPIISGHSLSRENSILLLDHCLVTFNKNSDAEACLFFDFSAEERTVLGDIFRFGAKLEDSESPLVGLGDDASLISSSDSSLSSGEEVIEYASRRKGYSLACGMLNLSWFRSKPNPSRQNIKGRKKEKAKQQLLETVTVGLVEDMLQCADKDTAGKKEIKYVATLVASILVELAIPAREQPVRSNAWKKASSLAFLLLGQDESLLPKASPAEFTRLGKLAAPVESEDEQKRVIEDQLAGIMTRSMISCRTEIGIVAAGKLLDLVLVILMRHASDLDSSLPGLLVVGCTAAFVSERIGEILDENDTSTPLSRSFWAAKDRAQSLHSV